jgi:hypothetical protein
MLEALRETPATLQPRSSKARVNANPIPSELPMSKAAFCIVPAG